VISVVTRVVDLVSQPLLFAAATPEGSVSPQKINSIVSHTPSFGFVSMPPRPQHCIRYSCLLPVASVSYDIVCNIINFDLIPDVFFCLKFIVAKAASLPI
jgi:hypothetical protein